jgi:hypothetical protein
MPGQKMPAGMLHSSLICSPDRRHSNEMLRRLDRRISDPAHADPTEVGFFLEHGAAVG